VDCLRFIWHVCGLGIGPSRDDRHAQDVSSLSAGVEHGIGWRPSELVAFQALDH
jgi:hypothetical protein